MKKRPLFLKNDEKGQTAIEYVLLLLVMTSVITSMILYIKNKYLGDPTQCAKAANRGTLLCSINRLIQDPNSLDKKFQYFPFKK